MQGAAGTGYWPGPVDIARRSGRGTCDACERCAFGAGHSENLRVPGSNRFGDYVIRGWRTLGCEETAGPKKEMKCSGLQVPCPAQANVHCVRG